MRHRTLFLHIAILFAISQLFGSAGVAAPFDLAEAAATVPLVLLDALPVGAGDPVRLAVPGPGVLIVDVVGTTRDDQRIPWIEVGVPTGGNPVPFGVAQVDTLSRRIDQQVAVVTGPAVYALRVGTIEPTGAVDQPLLATARFVAFGMGGVTKDGDADDTGESDNEILPQQTQTGDPDGDADDTGESDNEILPLSNSEDSDDTGESDNEILPLSGEPTTGRLGDHHWLVLNQPSVVTLNVVVRGSAQITIFDQAGRTLRTQIVDPVSGSLAASLVLPSGRYRVRLGTLDGQPHDYALAVRAQPLR